MKYCRVCKTEKDESLFNRDRNRPDGRKSNCKACVSEYRREFRRRHPEKRVTTYRYRPPTQNVPLPSKEWFMDRITPEPNTGCWLWLRGMIKGGYGVVFKGSRSGRYAHRVSYELFVGPIPDGIIVCHKCDTPLCCNPRHLFLGTVEDNMQDMVRKGRAAKPANFTAYEKKLDEQKVIEIRKRAEYTPLRKLAREYNVSPTAIRCVVRRVTWRSVA